MSQKIKPISFDYSGALLEPHGLSQADIDGLKENLLTARQEVLEVDVQLFDSGADVPAEKQPLDAGFIEMPKRILAAYASDRDNSELGRILKTAKRIRESVDRVVVLGIGGSYMGARALMESCCEPYFNEMSRAERGGRPRVYFEGNNVDNDSTHGLLNLLGNGKPATGIDDRWAIVVISKSGGTIETAVAFRQFLAALSQSVGGDAKQLAQLVVPVTGKSGKLFELSDAIGCQDRFEVPDGVGGRFSILSAVGLLPAAILGIDVVALLEGAVAMTEHLRASKPGDNVVLDFVAVNHLLESKKGADIRILSVWSKALEAAGLWYDQLLAESLGKNEQGALPLTVVNTRDLHSRAQQHQEGKRDKFITNVITDSWRCDPIPVGQSENDQDGLNELAEKGLPELMSAAIKGTNQAYREDGRPTCDLHLPAINESTMGQYFQLLMLATSVEGRLMGSNPYGQPGVEKYKTNMNRNLGRK